jgi:glucose/arabinose dehydrogenase
MKSVWRIISVACCSVLASCGGSNSPPSPAPGPGGSETINGTERLGWNQTAADPAELATFRYAIYVDGARSEIGDSSCSSSGAGYACSGRLPAMTAGSHVIEVATFVLDGATVVESPRSTPLTVTVRGATAGAGPAARAFPASVTTSEGVQLAVESLAADFDMPVDLAVARDGRLLVAEQGGRISFLTPGDSESRPAIVLDDVLVTEPEGGLLAIALDPDFERTRFVFALHTTPGRAGEPSFRVVRLREVAGTLGERVVLLDDIPAAVDRPSGSLRFGPDAKLYVALDDGGRADAAGRLSSYNGKVLRLNGDGTTPADQPAGSPVYAVGPRSPRGIDWQPETGALWVVDGGGGESRATAFRQPNARSRGSATSVVNMPAGSSPRSASFYRAESIPAFDGDLLIADGEALHRLKLGGRGVQELVSTERLLVGGGDQVRAVTVGRDGSIYVATGTAVLRLRAESR